MLFNYGGNQEELGPYKGTVIIPYINENDAWLFLNPIIDENSKRKIEEQIKGYKERNEEQ